MKIAHASSLEDFGTRSLVVHAIVAVTFVNAVLVGLFVEGQLGLVLFVALINATAGLWVAHSIHSLGTAVTDEEYTGIINELFDTGDEPDAGFDRGRFGRLIGLISAVTAVSLLTSAQVLTGPAFSVAVVAVGTIALVTAIIGFLIAAGASYDAAQERSAIRLDRNTEAADID